MYKQREIILDTETTGLAPKDGHRVIEIGAMEMVNKVLTGKCFHTYINPKRDVPDEAYRIHGISSEKLKRYPVFEEIEEQFLEFVGLDTIIAHNANFDISFLNHELSISANNTERRLDINNVIDTLDLARKLFPGAKVSLDALCKRFKVDNSNRQLHGALKDAGLLAEVYVYLTGGRQVSFDIQSKKIIEKEKIDNNDFTRMSKNRNVITIKPTKEELKKHKEFIAQILSNM